MIELDLTKFDHLQHVSSLERVHDTDEDIHVRKLIGSAVLPDGTYCNFQFELTRLGGAPKACLDDETGHYIVTIVRHHYKDTAKEVHATKEA